MDCEILYITPKRKTVSVNLKIDNIIKHEFDFSNIEEDIEEIEDSWESVSHGETHPPNCDACDMFELPADYGYDMAKFNAYCETYNNAVKQCWGGESK